MRLMILNGTGSFRSTCFETKNRWNKSCVTYRCCCLLLLFSSRRGYLTVLSSHKWTIACCGDSTSMVLRCYVCAVYETASAGEFRILWIVTEPTTEAYACMFQNLIQMKALRSDYPLWFWGRTFYTTVIRDRDGRIDVVAKEGKIALGGEKIDAAFCDYIISSNLDAFSEFQEVSNDTKNNILLLEQWEKVKVNLFESTQVNIDLHSKDRLYSSKNSCKTRASIVCRGLYYQKDSWSCSESIIKPWNKKRMCASHCTWGVQVDFMQLRKFLRERSVVTLSSERMLTKLYQLEQQ